MFRWSDHPQHRIYVMKIDGSGQVPLTPLGEEAVASAWSPDGQHVVFFSSGDGNWYLNVMNADGSGRVRLVTGNDKFELDRFSVISGPALSPDARRIAFGGGPDTDRRGVYAVGSDGGGLTRLANGWSPAWSRDGRQIAFVGEDVQIHLVKQ
jgi:TolB protein